MYKTVDGEIIELSDSEVSEMLAEWAQGSEDLKSKDIENQIEDHLNYLTSTDWYAIRKLEEPSRDIPQNILDERQKARDAISQLRKIIDDSSKTN